MKLISLITFSLALKKNQLEKYLKKSKHKFKKITKKIDFLIYIFNLFKIKLKNTLK
jgi:hypothetical protein